MNLIEAARLGNLGEVNEILASGAVHSADDYANALKQAVFNGHSAIVDRLLETPGVREVAAADNNATLCSAAAMGHFAVVNSLLAIPAVVANAAARESFGRPNAALYWAAVMGHFSIVDRLLQIPAVVGAINTPVVHGTHGTLASQMLHEVQMRANGGPQDFARYQPILDRLMQIPVVAALLHQQENEVMELAERAQFSENSMQSFTASQRSALDVLKKHYQKKYQSLEINWEITVAQIKSYLESRYQAEPVDPNESLPKAYYQHKIHSAWRYLSVPNPWMSEAAGHVGVLEEGGRHAIISDADKEIISYLWLALNDEEVVLEEGCTLEQNRNIFAEVLAHLGRAHNWDKEREATNAAGDIVLEHYDDLEGDKPSCQWGVAQRLLEAPYNHPYLLCPELRELNAEIMNQRLADWLCDPQNEENLFQKLDLLDKDTQESIYRCVNDIVMGERPENSLLEKTEAALKISEQGMEKLIEQARQWFGVARINATDEVYYNPFFGSHAGYIPLIRYLMSHPVDAFAKKIYDHLLPKFSPPPVFTPAREAFPSSGQKHEKDEDDKGKSPETKRKRHG